MATLSIAGLRKHIGASLLLNIDSFALQGGVAYALTGRNGSGKTTLLRIIGGLEGAEQGSLSWSHAGAVFQQVNCNELPRAYPVAWRRDVIYVHQQPFMLRGTVRSNIAYGLKLARIAEQEAAQRTNAAIAWAQLEQLAEHDAKTLSGGEKQRAALARAHALAPKLWLLDEPTANLDGASREQVIALIQQLAKSGSTVVVATHDRDLLIRASLTRMKLQDGILIQRDN